MTEPSERPFEVNEDSLAVDTRFSYVRGYIVALEDVLSDIDRYVHRSKYAITIRAMVQHTLDQANKTLETLESLQSRRDQP